MKKYARLEWRVGGNQRKPMQTRGKRTNSTLKSPSPAGYQTQNFLDLDEWT